MVLGSIILFVVASVDIYDVLKYTIEVLYKWITSENFHEEIVAKIIGAVDLYLISSCYAYFSFGIYELFISKIDTACNEENENCSTILAIHSLDQLKDKIAKSYYYGFGCKLFKEFYIQISNTIRNYYILH